MGSASVGPSVLARASGAAPRVVSLVPGATEMLLALDTAAELVGRSHECDHPPKATRAPVLTAAPTLGGSSAEIDAEFAAGEGRPTIDSRLLEQLRPDIVITQDLCVACAPGAEEVQAMCGASTTVLSCSPVRLDDVIETAVAIGSAIEAAGAGEALAARLRARIDACRESAGRRPAARVVCLEWLDPLYRARHWIPDQIEASGGRDLLGEAGTPARPMHLREVLDANAELVVLMPCGRGAQAAWDRARVEGVLDSLAGGIVPPKVVAADANAHFSRPGPRLVDGVEWLSATMEGLRAESGRPALR